MSQSPLLCNCSVQSLARLFPFVPLASDAVPPVGRHCVTHAGTGEISVYEYVYEYGG